MNGWGEIGTIYLKPEYFGKGYGKLLLSFCIKELKNIGFERIYLWTLEKNLKARAFYEKFGFTFDGEKGEHNFGGESLTVLRYAYFFRESVENNECTKIERT